jgi:glucosamine--fructose-6-phosphate aminotransferase (isomerizing)
MCGIVGYIGSRNAADVITKGLHRLEYRGYDSAGVAVVNGKLAAKKCKGKVATLETLIKNDPLTATVGIGHTRWATHGEPNDINAHPHYSGDHKFALVHNGIIENYDAIKKDLLRKGHTFDGQTDTEVLAHFIEEIHRTTGVAFPEAVRLALNQVTGTYGIAIVHEDFPNQIIVARKGSPLLIGVGENEFFVASDASPVIEYTNKVVYLDDGEMAVINRNGYETKTIDNKIVTKEIAELAFTLEEIEKGGFPHFMMKEIFFQPESIRDCLRGRIDLVNNDIVLGGIRDVMDKLVNAPRIIIAACGTSWHAGLVGEYLIEQLAGIPVEVEYASEFRYRNPIIRPNDVMLVISQSGETADTLAALREAKAKGAMVLGICNVVGSTIARETTAGIYTHAGPEIGVASTKAFTAQVAVLTMLALKLAKERKTISGEDFDRTIRALDQIPERVKEIFAQEPHIKEIAGLFTYAPNFLYLGRSFNFPVALEGALKLKEISYAHAEGYPAAEMKHGPIALIDQHMPVVVIASAHHINEKVISNIQEVKARRGRIIAVINKNNEEVRHLSEFCIEVPETEDVLTPLLSVVPLQLLAYHIAVNRGCNVDQPRNLAKSVTVE